MTNRTVRRVLSLALLVWLAVGGCCALVAACPLVTHIAHRDCCPKDSESSAPALDDCPCCLATGAISAFESLPAILPVPVAPVFLPVTHELIVDLTPADRRGLYLVNRVLRI